MTAYPGNLEKCVQVKYCPITTILGLNDAALVAQRHPTDKAAITNKSIKRHNKIKLRQKTTKPMSILQKHAVSRQSPFAMEYKLLNLDCSTELPD